MPDLDRPEIIAACDTCGFGYLTLQKWGLPCLRECGGHIWFLPKRVENRGKYQDEAALRVLAQQHRKREPK
jgi:hypothetical protein